MQLENFTPWPHLLFERGDSDDRRWMVLTLQGTFSIPRGAPLEPLAKQEPVAAIDEFRGDPRTTSLKRSGAIATRKPNSDITVDAVARTAEPRENWNVRLEVGKLESKLQARAPRPWHHDEDDGWVEGEPEPCTEVPIDYEHAFGGRHEIDGELVEEPRNPLGVGFLPEQLEDRAPRPAPQIVAPDEPAHEPGKTYAPKGWAPIPGYFAPRRDCVGTADEQWRRTRWPRPPADFDDAFYQAAHPDLIYPGYLIGDERVRMEGVTQDGQAIDSSLPGWFVFLLVRIDGGKMVMQPARLDTLHLDVADGDRANHRAYLTWRAVLPKAEELWRVEARMMPLSALRSGEAA
jgi:hypothetical protein